jgi:cytochrome bd-type quinol oxidase subunit 1
MKKWTVGELQALRAAWRFMVGLGALAIIVSVGLLILYQNLSPEQKSSDVHKHDVLTGIIILIVAAAFVVAGWKLRSYLKKCERETGQSSKPFGWVP